MLFSLFDAGTFAEFARAVIAVGTKLDHFSPTTADIELADALVEFPREIVVLHSDGQEVLLIVKAVEPVRGQFTTELVVIKMDLLQLAVSDPGIAFGDASGELCGRKLFERQSMNAR